MAERCLAIRIYLIEQHGPAVGTVLQPESQVQFC